jgi:hypothetical protein
MAGLSAENAEMLAGRCRCCGANVDAHPANDSFVAIRFDSEDGRWDYDAKPISMTTGGPTIGLLRLSSLNTAGAPSFAFF